MFATGLRWTAEAGTAQTGRAPASRQLVEVCCGLIGALLAGQQLGRALWLWEKARDQHTVYTVYSEHTATVLKRDSCCITSVQELAVVCADIIVEYRTAWYNGNPNKILTRALPEFRPQYR